MHVVGFAIGIALFAWAVSLAMRGENQQALARLRALPASTIAWLVLLTLASLGLNGVMFWITARPLWMGHTEEAMMRRLPIFETIATNCIATFLSLLPFKLGLLVRSVVHVKRHGVAVPVLLAWFAVFGGMTVVVALLAGGIALARGVVDGWWVLFVVMGIGVIAMLCALLATRAVAVVQAVAKKFPVVSPFAALAAPAATILASPATFGLHAVLRLLDFATFAARFAILAGALGIALTHQQSLLLGSTFLVLNASAPAGSLGFADMGVAGAGSLLGLQKEQIVLLSLVTTALQTAVAGMIALVAWPLLRIAFGEPRVSPGMGERSS